MSKNMIQAYRLRKGWTVRELTKQLGEVAKPSGVVLAWETGKEEPNFAQLRKLAEVLGCTADELIAEPMDSDTLAVKEWREALDPVRKRMAELQRVKLDTDNELKAIQMALQKMLLGGNME